MRVSVRNDPTQIGPDTDTCKYDSDDACPSVERNPHIRGQDPSSDYFDNQHREAGKKNNGTGFHLFSPRMDGPFAINPDSVHGVLRFQRSKLGLMVDAFPSLGRGIPRSKIDVL